MHVTQPSMTLPQSSRWRVSVGPLPYRFLRSTSLRKQCPTLCHFPSPMVRTRGWTSEDYLNINVYINENRLYYFIYSVKTPVRACIAHRWACKSSPNPNLHIYLFHVYVTMQILGCDSPLTLAYKYLNASLRLQAIDCMLIQTKLFSKICKCNEMSCLYNKYVK